jgi:hypothetical protein
MGWSRVSAGVSACGLFCLLFSIQSVEVPAQTAGSYDMPFPNAAASQPWSPSAVACEPDCRSAASVYVGWVFTPQRLRIGYSGLVLPGKCGSSHFLYPLNGVRVGGSVPVRLLDRFDLRAYGSYLFPQNREADQEITWLIFPTGFRQWRHTRSDSYVLGGELLMPSAGGTALVGGFRWESLTTTFKDPDPTYRLTVDTMQSQVTVTAYEPYVGFRLQQSAGPGTMTAGLVGLPFLLATIQHFNTCNNAGDPLAHVGSAKVTRGYFVEASAEYRLGLVHGFEATGFVAWDLYHGECPMFLERIDSGLGNSTTGAVVDFSYDRSSFTVGGKVDLSWNLPF